MIVFPVVALIIPRISKYLKCRCKAVEIVCGGMMIISITHANQNFLSGKSNLAKPYPTTVHIAICKTAMVSEISTVFPSVFQ